eukprot:3040739-Prymnesium_polylepis.1
MDVLLTLPAAVAAVAGSYSALELAAPRHVRIVSRAPRERRRDDSNRGAKTPTVARRLQPKATTPTEARRLQPKATTPTEARRLQPRRDDSNRGATTPTVASARAARDCFGDT